MKPVATFSELLQRFFTDRLMRECNASPLTIANYRDTFCLLIAYVQRCLKKPPTKIAMEDLNAPFILRFLDYIERERGNSPRSRNVRLAAIHSFFNFVALHEPAAGAVAQRVLAIQSKRCARKPVDFLTRAESEAIINVPNQTACSGRRDRTLLLVAHWCPNCPVCRSDRRECKTALRVYDDTNGTSASYSFLMVVRLKQKDLRV